MLPNGGHITFSMKRVFLLVLSFANSFVVAASDTYLRGRLVDANGTGLGGIVFRGHFQNSIETSAAQETAPDGSFALAVSPGTWSFHIGEDAQARGLIDHWVYRTFAEGQDQTILFVVPTPTGKISGFVRDQSSNNLANIHVNAFAITNEFVYDVNAKTDAQGRFELPVLDAIWLLSLPCNELELRKFDCPEGRTVYGTGNNVSQNFTLEPLSPHVTLSGRVMDDSGAGIPGVQLTAYLSGSATSRNVISGADGAFTIPVFNGTWFIDVTGNLPENKIWPKHVFDITGTNVSDIEYKLLATDATISGIVKTWTGAPLSNVEIWARTLIDGFSYSAASRVSNASGQFSIPVSRRASWAVGANCGQLIQMGYLCAGLEAPDISSGEGQAEFIVIPRVVHSPRILSPRFMQGAPSTFSFTLQGDPGKYIIQGGPTPTIFGPVRQSSEVTILPGQPSVEVSVDTGYHFFRAMGVRE
jgi:hypothetical protein